MTNPARSPERAREWQPCPECEGRGEYLDATANVLDGHPYMQMCHVCGGTGKIDPGARFSTELLKQIHDEPGHWSQVVRLVEIRCEADGTKTLLLQRADGQP